MGIRKTFGKGNKESPVAEKQWHLKTVTLLNFKKVERL